MTAAFGQVLGVFRLTILRFLKYGFQPQSIARALASTSSPFAKNSHSFIDTAFRDGCHAELAAKFEAADGLVVASPVYYGSANATIVAVLDRLFYSSHFDKTMKVGAAVSVARRGGLTATWDELNKYFGISGMPIASGQYWNGAHGRLPGEAEQDAEGMQQMRTLARNMAFLMKAIALAKDQYGLPEREAGVYTNFVR